MGGGGASHNSLTIHKYGKTTYGQLLKRHLCQGVKDKCKSMDGRGQDREGDERLVSHQ